MTLNDEIAVKKTIRVGARLVEENIRDNVHGIGQLGQDNNLS